jgi:UDP-3-O-[3-hydroxymyristoyl] glucosamine N-acyltransferase
MELKVKELAEKLGGELIGDGDGVISGVATLEAAGADKITFVMEDKLLGRLRDTNAGAVLAGKVYDEASKPLIIVSNVQASLIETLGIFAPKLTPPAEGIDESAKIGEGALIGKSSCIGPNVVIDDRAVIGENTVIGSGCRVGENTRIGNNCRIDSNVVIYHNCDIGNNVIIQANCTIGGTGFGYYLIEGANRLIPHNGIVVIEDFVEIGCNCCIDRAKFGETRIGAGTKIDNIIQIAHNVVIGKCCLIAAQVGIAGSAQIGNDVVLAGHVGVADNLKIGDGVIAAARSVILRDVEAGKTIFGFPAKDIKEEMRIISLIGRLPKMAEQIRDLRKRIKELEASSDIKK